MWVDENELGKTYLWKREEEKWAISTQPAMGRPIMRLHPEID